MHRRRIAFVYWPGPAPDSARLDTMPFALNVIKRLVAAQWEVDVFLWEEPGVDYREIFSPLARICYQVTPKGPFYSRWQIQLARLTPRFMTYRNYQCAFGLGQI